MALDCYFWLTLNSNTSEIITEILTQNRFKSYLFEALSFLLTHLDEIKCTKYKCDSLIRLFRFAEVALREFPDFAPLVELLSMEEFMMCVLKR